MTHLLIQSEHQWLTEELSARAQQWVSAVEVVPQPTWLYELAYAQQLNARSLHDLEKLMGAFEPLGLPCRIDQRLAPDTVVIKLGSVRLISESQLSIVGEATSLLPELSEALSQRFSIQHSGLGSPISSTLRYGGAPLLVRGMIRWVCAQRGVKLTEEQVWGEEEMDIHLSILDPARSGAPFRSALDVILISDIGEPDVTPLLDYLRRAGYVSVRVASGHFSSDLDTDDFVISTREGALNPTEMKRLSTLVKEGLARWGIDVEEYPVSLRSHPRGEPRLIAHDEVSPRVEIHLPIGRWRSGLLRPRGGDQLARWSVELEVDMPEYIDPLRESLARYGFNDSKVTMIQRRPDTEGAVMISWGSMREYSHRCALVRAAILELGEPPLWCEVSSLSELMTADQRSNAAKRGDDALKVKEDLVVGRVYVSDFEPRGWERVLHRLATQHEVILLGDLDQGWLTQIRQTLKRLPWRDLSTHLFSEPLDELVTSREPSQVLSELPKLSVDTELASSEFFGLSPDAPLDLDKIFDQLNEHPSPIQDWLMDSLHDSLDDSLLTQPCITYGSAPLILIEWMRVTLCQALGVECITRAELDSDDPDILIEIPPIELLTHTKHRAEGEKLARESIEAHSAPPNGETTSRPKLWLVTPPNSKHKSRRDS